MRYMFFILFLICSCEKGDNSTWAEYAEAMVKESEYMKLVNDHRKELGLLPLIHHDALGEIATDHSINMATWVLPFGHTGFSSRCSEARSVIGGGNLCAENVAKGQEDAQAVYRAWLNSSGHRANIEQSRFTHTGFGHQQSSDGTFYWTQIFIEMD